LQQLKETTKKRKQYQAVYLKVGTYLKETLIPTQSKIVVDFQKKYSNEESIYSESSH
jgi:hypothetical protein